jgi:hypothetical protein
VKEELGGSPSGPEILRVLSKRWGELDAEGKAVYEEQSRVEKQKYMEAMAEYKLTPNSAQQQQVCKEENLLVMGCSVLRTRDPVTF